MNPLEKAGVDVAKLEAGDVVIITFPEMLPRTYREALKADLEPFFKERGASRVLVLENGAALHIVRPDHVPEGSRHE